MPNGLLMGLSLVLITLWLGRKSNLEKLPRASRKARWITFKDAFWGLMMPVIILGGIYGGVFTPTEAEAVSAVYGLVGTIMIVNLAIGLVTPPVGVNLYVACGIGDVDLKTISKAAIPLILAALFVLMLVTYVPSLSLMLLGK